MGKHSAGGRNPFSRQHEHLGRSGTRRARPLRTLEGGSKASGQRLADTTSRRQGPLESAPARLKAERDRRRARYRRMTVVAALTVVAVLVVGAVGAFAYVRYLEKKMTPSVIVDKFAASLEKAPPQKPYNLLLIGADKRPYESTARADTMILARIDTKKKTVAMISIPRDSKVTIPGRGTAKINEAYALGGPQGAIDAVSELTDVPIHHYMQVDFQGFKKAVDAIGGVWVDVPVAINDRMAATHSRGRRAARIDAGYQLLDGEHALTFVRARHQFVDQDFSRMRNQQAFFKALADQAAKAENLSKLPRVVSAVAPYVVTDMKLIEMVRTAQALRQAGRSNISAATLPGEWRTPFIHIDEVAKDELMGRFRSGASLEATTTPQGEKAEAAAAAEPNDITITVRNGAGIAGSAKHASSILKARGFQVPEVGNANTFVYVKTLVVYKDDRKSAELVASALPPGAKLVESRGMYSFKTEVLVVVGKDWDLSRVPVTPVKTN